MMLRLCQHLPRHYGTASTMFLLSDEALDDQIGHNKRHPQENGLYGCWAAYYRKHDLVSVAKKMI